MKLHAIGHIRSTLNDTSTAPRQGSEGAPDAWLEVDTAFARALSRWGPETKSSSSLGCISQTAGSSEVHPRDDPRNPLTGVFATRSQDRPNPLGLHRVAVREIAGTRLRIGPIEAVDGTPVIDIKPVLSERDG